MIMMVLGNPQVSISMSRTPVLLSFGDRRKAMKDKFKGELFMADELADSNVRYRGFFRTDKIGIAKGVLKIDVGSVL